MAFSYASVIGTNQLSARLRRITLKIDDPPALGVRPGGDSAVGVYFPAIAPNGSRTVDPDSEGRNYSVRHHPAEDRIDLDFVLHARGLATSWAVATAPGDRVGLDHARSWYAPGPGTDWQLLVTDLSGLPATARIIDELPGPVPVTAIVEVADRDDLDYLPARSNVTVVSTVGTGNGNAPSRLAKLVREFTFPAGRGYCWFAGEAAESRTVRKFLRGLDWTIDQYDITGYWRFDSESWDEKYALVSDEIESVYVQALADGKGDKVASEEYDEALERAGL
jgi:NADPH-dependent ferric siderophore reductase